MSSGGNLYPNWLGTASLSIPSNSVQTNVQVQTIAGLSSYTTIINTVPQILMGFRSTTTINTTNPSEMLTYTVPASGWYQTNFQAVASHAGAPVTWSNGNFTQLDWYVTKNNSVQSNTAVLVQPQTICGDSVSEFISLTGTGLVQANSGDILQWVTDGNATPAVTSNYFSGFANITIQKIA
jgi:hypothetical protein